jgi:hypothetical protein
VGNPDCRDGVPAHGCDPDRSGRRMRRPSRIATDAYPTFPTHDLRTMGTTANPAMTHSTGRQITQ